MNRHVIRLGMLALCPALMSGCAPSHADMEAMLKQPARPPELDRLSAFVGNWSGEASIKMKGSDKVEKSTGKNTTRWAADEWVLVEEWQSEMGSSGAIKGVSMTRWDPSSKKYLSQWTDNHGGSGNGCMTYDPASKVWTVKAKSKDGSTGDTTVGEGTLKFTDPKTMDWKWCEWDKFKLTKVMELNGVSRKQ